MSGDNNVSFDLVFEGCVASVECRCWGFMSGDNNDGSRLC